MQKKIKRINLLIDIGNTNTSMVVDKNGRFVKHYFIYTSKKEISEESFKRLLGRYLKRIDKVVVVSVVPDFLKILKQTFSKIAKDIPLFVVGQDVEVPIKNLYKYPKQVGQDRLVTSYAALSESKPPLIAIDFGTAVTMDYVNKKGAYVGGLIFPGIRLALRSLVEDTALLPRVAIKHSGSELVGRDTRASMNNGIVYGYGSMCDGLISKLRKKYGKDLKVIATGGDAKLISEYSTSINNISPDLIFKGLSLIAKNIK